MTTEKPGVGYMVQLDGIRAFAVGGVIVEHWASGMPQALRRLVESLDLGGLGVECFFVLSGFLITSILLETKERNLSFRESLGHFYVRRVLRIFPAYYFALLATYLLFAPMRDVFGWHALYLSNIYPAWHGGWPPIGGHFWSLSVEEQFYLFWPLIVLSLPMARIRYAALACFLLAPWSRLLLWHLYGGDHVAIWTLTTSALDLLCFGAFLACVKHRTGLARGSSEMRRLALMGASALLLYAALFFLAKGTVLHATFGRTLTAVFCGALIASAANGLGGLAGRVLSNRLVVWLGIVSYGLYIFHPFIPSLYLRALELLALDRGMFGAFYIRYPLLAAMLLTVTASSYYLLEKPVRGLRRRFL